MSFADAVKADAKRQSIFSNERHGSANLSPLMVKKRIAENSYSVAYVCPFGCEEEDCDKNGYCDHLIGFTVGPVDEDDQESAVFHAHRCDHLKDDTGHIYRRQYWVVGNRAYPVKAEDILMRTTISYRVYREGGIDSLVGEKPVEKKNRGRVAATK